MEDLKNKLKEVGIRFGIWIAVILIALAGFGIVKFFAWMFAPVPDTYVNYNLNNLNDFSAIENVSMSSYDVIYNENSEPIAIVDISDKNIEGYTEIRKSIFSPMVIYVGELALKPDSGFSVSDTNLVSSSVKVQKNLSNILMAMEQGKTWEDIGINKNCLEGKIVLAVPDKYSPYRKEVKDLFILNLADNEVTADNYEELSTRADALLEKCIQVEDAKSYLVMNKTKDAVGKIALIAPEYLMNFDQDSLFTRSLEEEKQESFLPVYPTRTTAITYSLYVKNDLEEDLKNKVLDSYNGAPISKKTGFRTIKYNSKYVSGNNILEDINVKYIER